MRKLKEDIVSNVIQDINKYEVFAFDFWDTIIHRDCENYFVIFEWAKELGELLGRKTDIIVEKRKEASAKLKVTLGVEECNYFQMIECLHKLLSVSIELSEFYYLSLKIELDAERRHCYADEETRSLIEYLKENNKKIIIISDFYMGAEALSEILSYCDINIGKTNVFVSSDVGLRKDTGNLYKYVINKLNLSSNAILMLGDNSKVDVEIPSDMGISCIHKVYQKKKVQPILSKKALLKQILKNINQKGESLNGYSSLLCLIASRLYRTLRNNSVKQVFFLSREGQLLKQVFDLYQDMFVPIDLRIESFYFYASRRATLVAGLDSIQNERFLSITNGGKRYTITEILSFIGMDKDIITNLLDNCGIDGNETISNNEVNENLFAKLSRSNLFISEYDKLRLNQKEMFLDYLNSFRCDLNTGFHIVDIGWRGTIQDNIRKILPSDIIIDGYYIGIFDDEKGVNKCDISEISKKTPVIFSSYNKNGMYHITVKNRMFWETLFTANHGPVNGYQRDALNAVIPVIDNTEEYLEIYNFLAPYLDELMNCYKHTLLQFRMSNNSIFDMERWLLSMYAWQVNVMVPKNKSFFDLIESHIHDNYLKDIKNNRTSFWEKQKKVLQYYFGKNKNYLRIFWKKKSKILNSTGNIYCGLRCFIVILWNVILRS